MVSIVPLIYLCSSEIYFQSLKCMVVKRNFYVPFIQASFISYFVHLFLFPSVIGWGGEFIAFVIWRHIFCFLQPLYQFFFVVIKKPMEKKRLCDKSNLTKKCEQWKPQYDPYKFETWQRPWYCTLTLLQGKRQSGDKPYPFLTSSLAGGDWSAACLAPFSKGKKAGANWTGNCVSRRARLGALKKINLFIAGKRTMIPWTYS
jgi:hypothetical protein